MSRKILVVNGPSYGSSVEGLGKLDTNVTEFIKNPENYKLILFTGGADITPEYYGEKSPNNLCYNNEKRDQEELIIFELALKHKIRMIGICRGSQFLNVMAGGTMLHDVDNHSVTRHGMETYNSGVIVVNSLHHQMIIPNKNSIVIGWADSKQSTKYYGNHDLPVEAPEKEVEAVLFPNINAAGVQYHPEMMPIESDGAVWFHNLAESLIKENNFSTIVNKYAGDLWKVHRYMSAGH